MAHGVYIFQKPENAVHIVRIATDESLLEELIQDLEDRDFFVTLWGAEEIKEELVGLDETMVEKFEKLSAADKETAAMLIISYLEGDIIVKPGTNLRFDIDNVLDRVNDQQEAGPRHPEVCGWRAPVLVSVRINDLDLPTKDKSIHAWHYQPSEPPLTKIYVAEERCPTTLLLLRQLIPDCIPVLAPVFEPELTSEPIQTSV